MPTNNKNAWGIPGVFDLTGVYKICYHWGIGIIIVNQGRAKWRIQLKKIQGEIKRLESQLQATERCIVNNRFDQDDMDIYQEDMVHYQRRINELCAQMCHLSVMQTKAQMTR